MRLSKDLTVHLSYLSHVGHDDNNSNSYRACLKTAYYFILEINSMQFTSFWNTRKQVSRSLRSLRTWKTDCRPKDSITSLVPVCTQTSPKWETDSGTQGPFRLSVLHFSLNGLWGFWGERLCLSCFTSSTQQFIKQRKEPYLLSVVEYLFSCFLGARNYLINYIPVPSK